MAPLNPPAWMQAGSYPARLDRLVLAGVMTADTGAGPIAPRSGVRPAATGAGLGVVQRTGTDMYVTVHPGTAFIAATAADGGAYECVNDAAFDVLLSAAHATLPRKDLIVARVYDAVDGVGSRNEWAIETVTGVAAASPNVPATPAGAIALAQVTVPAAATAIVTANITDVRPYTVAAGGVLPVTGQTQRDAISAYAGQRVYRRDTGATETYTGTYWDGGQNAISTDLATPPSTFTTDATFTEFSAGQWPPIDITCPASGALAITIRADAYNSSTVNSSFRFGVVVKDQTAGGGIVMTASTLRGPCIIRSIAQSQSGIIQSDRHLLGGGGELLALAGHTLRIVPAWYISSHQFQYQVINTGRLTVEALPYRYVAN